MPGIGAASQSDHDSDLAALLRNYTNRIPHFRAISLLLCVIKVTVSPRVDLDQMRRVETVALIQHSPQT